jgi:hypothetical protein
MFMKRNCLRLYNIVQHGTPDRLLFYPIGANFHIEKVYLRVNAILYYKGGSIPLCARIIPRISKNIRLERISEQTILTLCAERLDHLNSGLGILEARIRNFIKDDTLK